MENSKHKITAIRAGKNPGVQRAKVFLDGKFAFSLENEVILRETLKIGRELSQAEIDLLTHADVFQRCLNTAFRFLSYRPRSEVETRARLVKRGFEADEIERVITRLKKLSLLDDAAFAEYWKENRNSFRPRSQKMLKQELRRKGVESEVINEVVEDIDETENAYRAALTRVRTLPVSDYQVFHQRLGGYLQRRGFNYGVINKVVKQTWQERTGNSGDLSELAGESVNID
jgi:regulatory protein